MPTHFILTVDKTKELALSMRVERNSGVVSRRYKLIWMGNRTEWRPLTAPDFRAVIPSSFLGQVNATIMLEYVSEGTTDFKTFSFFDQTGQPVSVKDMAGAAVAVPVEVNVLGTNVGLQFDIV